MICPVIEGKRSAIPLGVKPVYSTSDGEGGKGAELAHGIYDDLKAHAGLENASLLQVQGKVTDGKNINVPFLTAINQPILNLLSKISPPEDLALLKQYFW